MRQSGKTKYKGRASGIVLTMVLMIMVAIVARSQRITPTGVNKPALPYSVVTGAGGEHDTIAMQFPVQKTVAEQYEQLMGDESALDLTTPSNIKTVAEFDPTTGIYVVRTKVGEHDITTPFILSEKQYNNWQLRKSMEEYFGCCNYWTYTWLWLSVCKIPK